MGHGGIAFLSLFFAAAVFATDGCADHLVAHNPSLSELSHYTIIQPRLFEPRKDIGEFRAQTGIWVSRRDEAGRARTGFIRVLSDNPGNQIAVIGAFNAWGNSIQLEDNLRSIPGTPYFEGTIRELHDGMEYRLLLNGDPVLDPSSTQFTTPEMLSRFRPNNTPYLNSVFSDLEAIRPRPSQPVDFRGRASIIAESEVYALSSLWPEKNRIGPALVADTYRFIADSGIPRAIADRGYTHLELLPFTSSVDGARWQFRYQSFGLFGPDSRYGTPEEFRKMVAAFNREGVGIIMDAVLGHYPFRANEGIRSLEPIGIHRFINGFGKPLFGGNTTVWGTYRWDFQNPFVRRFLIDSVLTLFRDYGLSGIRIDNVDGIRQEPGGSTFLRELNSELRDYLPQAIILGEMFEDQTPALTSIDGGGLGFHASNDVDFFYNFVQKHLQAWDHEIQLQKLEWFLNDSWRWKRVPMQRWITNHDEAANRQPGASGDYVATLLAGGKWDDVEAKTRVWGALGMLIGSVYLDMPQMRLLQEGNFTNSPAVDWSLLKHPSQRRTDSFFSALSKLIRDGAEFSPQNLHPHIVNHIDNDNKVVSLLRTDFATGRRTYALLNLGSKSMKNYRFGVDATLSRSYSVVLSSDEIEFGGTGLDYKRTILAEPTAYHDRPHSIVLPTLSPRGVVIFRTPG